MIFGIGTDICAIGRIEKMLEHHGERFARKILSEHELNFFRTQSQPAAYLASRFAAKEALVKALGTGMRDGIWFTQITVVNDEFGKPSFQCTGEILRRMQLSGVKEAQLALSHEKEYAVSFVVLQSSQQTD